MFTAHPAVADTSIASGFKGTNAATVVSATYTYAGTGGTTYGPSTTAPTNVGTYSVVPSAATLNFTSGSASNYSTLMNYVAATLTINQAPLTISTATQNLTWTGSAAVADTSNLTGVQSPDAASISLVTYTYNGTGGTTYGPSTTAPTNVGTYSTAPSAATLNFTSGSASNYSTSFAYIPGSLTISPASQASLVITSINGGNHATGYVLTTSGGSGTGTVTYTVTNGSVQGCAISASAPYTLTANKAGDCNVVAIKAADGNYAATSSVVTIVTLAS
jgi:predicted Zn-dependent protease